METLLKVTGLNAMFRSPRAEDQAPEGQGRVEGQIKANGTELLTPACFLQYLVWSLSSPVISTLSLCDRRTEADHHLGSGRCPQSVLL